MTAWQALRFAGELIIDLVREARQERAAERARNTALAPKRAEASRRYRQASNAAGPSVSQWCVACEAEARQVTDWKAVHTCGRVVH